jgi:hypothetical protein
MKYQTQDINKQTNNYKPGICRVFFIPLGILSSIKTDVNGVFQWPLNAAGTIYENVTYANFQELNIIELDLVKETFKFRQTRKESKAGQFFEIAIMGETNNLTPLIRRSLETLILKPVQVLILSRTSTSRIVGSTDRGLDVAYSATSENNGSGIDQVSIEIIGQSATTAPFTTFTL